MKSQEVLNSLFELYSENKFAHAYLIETNNIELCLKDINKLIKMTFCPKEYSENCSECNLCRLLDNNSLPSVVVIKPNGKTINNPIVHIGSLTNGLKLWQMLWIVAISVLKIQA